MAIRRQLDEKQKALKAEQLYFWIPGFAAAEARAISKKKESAEIADLLVKLRLGISRAGADIFEGLEWLVYEAMYRCTQGNARASLSNYSFGLWGAIDRLRQNDDDYSEEYVRKKIDRTPKTTREKESRIFGPSPSARTKHKRKTGEVLPKWEGTEFVESPAYEPTPRQRQKPLDARLCTSAESHKTSVAIDFEDSLDTLLQLQVYNRRKERKTIKEIATELRVTRYTVQRTLKELQAKVLQSTALPAPAPKPSRPRKRASTQTSRKVKTA